MLGMDSDIQSLKLKNECMSIDVWLASMSVCHVHALFLKGPVEGIRTPGTEVADSFELPSRYCKLNSGPLKK